MHFMSGLAALAVAADTACALRVFPVEIGKPRASALRRRTNTYSETLANNVSEGSYIATVQVGTPPQTVQLAIDTGSSDVWVVGTNTNLCTSELLQEEFGPCLTPFDTGSSSSYKLVSTGSFRAEYADGTGASGNYISDDLSIGGATVKAMQLGLATKSEIPMGLLGIGFDSNEATVKGTVYPNLVDALVSGGSIGSKAYSLYLNDLQSSTGTILFGGIDTGKYIGSLKAVPIEPDESGQYVDFTVALSSLSGTSGGGNSTTYVSNATPVVLDSGTTLMYLDLDTVNRIYKQFNAYDDTEESGLVYVDCNHLTSDPKFTFDFQFGGSSGPTISVPVDEIIQNDIAPYLGGVGGLELPPDLPFPASRTCSFGIQGSNEVYLLGDTFLRSAYAVYDLDKHEIALAQANFNSTESNVVEIASASGIPDVTGVASQVTVVQTATGLPGPGRQTTGAGATGTRSGGGGGGGGGGGQATGTSTVSSGGGATSSNSAAGLRPPGASFEPVVVAVVAGVFAVMGGALMVL